MSIRQRIIWLVVLAFAALTFIGGFSVRQARRSAQEVQRVTEGIVPTALKSATLLTQLKDVQIATLSMVSAVEPQTIEQTHAAVNARKQALQQALEEQLTRADSVAQRGLVQQAQEGLVNYFSSIDETVKYKLANQKELAEATLAATVDQYLREQEGLINTLQIEKNRSKDESIAALNAGLRATEKTLWIASLGAALAMVAVGTLLYRRIARPIGEMQAKMSAIASSQDLTHRVPVKRMDEIGRSIVAFNTMIGKIQDAAELVRARTADMHAMLQAVPQGILTLQPDGRIHPEFSEHLKVILDRDDLAGRDLDEVLFADADLSSDARAQVRAAIDACIGEDPMNFEFNAHILPQEITRTMPSGTQKVLDLNWSPMAGVDGMVDRLLLCVRDVTELRALSRAAAQQQRHLQLIGEILALTQEKFEAFIDGAVDLVEQCATVLRRATTPADRAEAVALLFRHMHTLKGNARTQGLQHLASEAHEIENTLSRLREDPSAWDADALAREIARARTLLAEYAQISEVTLGRRGPGRRGAVEKFVMLPKEQAERLLNSLTRAFDADASTLRTAVEDATRTLRRIGTERIEDVLFDVLASLPSLASDLGKPEPLCRIEDHGIAVRSQIAGTLRNVFVHLYRNAVDHGLEPAAERLQAGKAAAGRIDLALRLDGDRLQLVLRDDGRGLALARIREKALAAGLVAADASPLAVAAAIFEPGFSTKDRVSGVSGRGVGMDAVRALLKADSGDIALRLLDRNDAGHVPFETVITLPAKFAMPNVTATSERIHA